MISIYISERYVFRPIQLHKARLVLRLAHVQPVCAVVGGGLVVDNEGGSCCLLGGKIGFPTVNVKIPPEKFNLKDGVYGGHVFIRGKFFKCIINYGARPTFDLSGKLIEAHIADFYGDLYGKKITLYFDFYIREIRKFADAAELKKRLELDLKTVKDRTYD